MYVVCFVINVISPCISCIETKKQSSLFSVYEMKPYLNHHSSATLCLFLQDLRAILDSGSDLPFPDGLIINGRGSNANTFPVDQGIEQQ